MRSVSKVVAGVIAATTVGVLVGCSGDGDGAAVDVTTAPTTPASTSAPTTLVEEIDYFWTPDADLLTGAEGQVRIVAWPGYIEDEWTAPFEEMTGCAVEVTLGSTSDEMVRLMQSGGYDGVSASGDATDRLMAGGEVVALDLAEFSSYPQIFDGLKDKPWNSMDGRPMGIPHGRGANLLFFDRSTFPDGLNSWAPMWEPGSPAEGALSAYDSPIYIADAALWLMSTRPELGITDPYALDEEQFEAAIALLRSQEPLVAQYWSDYTLQVEAMVDRTVVAGTTWQVVANVANGLGADIEFVKPAEGATGWSDTWMLSSKAAHPNCMKLWMDWIASPWANARATEYFGEAPSNRESCNFTDDADHCLKFHAADERYFEDVWYWTTPTEACLDGRTDVRCVPYAEWVDAWAELRT